MSKERAHTPGQQAAFWQEPASRVQVPLEEASRIAGHLVEMLSPHCDRIAVAGSIRRRRPVVNDIDLVLIPRDMAHLMDTLRSAGLGVGGGDKVKTVTFEGLRADIYLATPTTWATLFLIRTGSAENNRRLCGVAKVRGWHLAANGDGLFDSMGRRVAGDTEQSATALARLPLPYPRSGGARRRRDTAAVSAPCPKEGPRRQA